MDIATIDGRLPLPARLWVAFESLVSPRRNIHEPVRLARRNRIEADDGVSYFNSSSKEIGIFRIDQLSDGYLHAGRNQKKVIGHSLQINPLIIQGSVQVVVERFLCTERLDNFCRKFL
jgi:hypothetical protein